MGIRLKSAILPAGIILYWGCYGIFYPHFYSTQDERVYLAKAHAVSQGNLFPENLDRSSLWMERYPSGQALLLSAFLQVGYSSVYLLNPTFLTLLVLILAALLEKNGVPRYFALLALFHPAFLLFSRTLLSDIPAAFFFLLALWLLLSLRQAYFFGAFALGFTVSLRVAMLPFASLCLLYVLWKLSTIRNAGQILGGFALGALPFFFYLYQSNFLSSYVASDVPQISLGNFFPHLAIYFLGLNTIYPLMFILGIIPRYREAFFFKTICLAALLFFPFFMLADPGDKTLLTLLILCQRFFLFIMGPLLIGYSLFLSRKLITNEQRFLPLILLLAVGAFGGSFLHQRMLDQNKSIHDAIYAYTPPGSILIVDDSAQELILNMFGERIIVETGEREPFQAERRALQEIFHEIDSFRSDAIFLIDWDRGDQTQWNAGKAILERYQSEEIVNQSNEGRILPEFITSRYRGGYLRIFRILPKYGEEIPPRTRSDKDNPWEGC